MQRDADLFLCGHTLRLSALDGLLGRLKPGTPCERQSAAAQVLNALLVHTEVVHTHQVLHGHRKHNKENQDHEQARAEARIVVASAPPLGEAIREEVVVAVAALVAQNLVDQAQPLKALVRVRHIWVLVGAVRQYIQRRTATPSSFPGTPCGSLTATRRAGDRGSSKSWRQGPRSARAPAAAQKSV